MKRFIHYGSDCFCRFKFNPVINGLPGETKPGINYSSDQKKRGGLWASPFGENSQKDWKTWWEHHNDMALRQVRFIFWLTDDAKILRITSPEDIPADLLRSDCDNKSIDFEAMARQYSAMWVDYSVIEKLQDSTFYGWECDTILVFDGKKVRYNPDD